MAGIGFELRKLLDRESLSGLLQAYGYAGIISSGPWVLSILGVMILGVLSIGVVIPSFLVIQFLVSVTYLQATSLILSGPFQLLFTRFVADRLFERRQEVILPNLFGAMALVTWISGVGGALVLMFLFTQESFLYRLLMLGGLVTLCNIWVVGILLSSLRAYRTVLWAFAVGYGLTVIAGLALRPFKIEGLLGGFLIGQATLLFLMLGLVVRHNPGNRLIAFDLLRRSQVYAGLSLTGFFFNVGVWADKFVFWMNPLTSQPIIGPLRASIIYDLPIFLAYLSIIPGMAVFLVRIEADFAEHYDALYDAIRKGAPLGRLERLKDTMVFVIRQGMYEIFKVQGMVVLLLFLAIPALLRVAGISQLYRPLLTVDVVGTGVQVLLLGILNVLMYLDQRGIALGLTALFAASNLLLTILTQLMGPTFYGYGFAASVTLTSLVGLALLSRKLDRLEYETFMLQRPAAG